MKNRRTLVLCFIFLIFVTQRSWSENVDTNAAYMTVFGRPATAAEISFWQTRLPATQAELVQINIRWLVSARGAGELVNVINRGFQEAFSRQPTAAEQQEWQNKIKTGKMTYSAFVAALKGKPNPELQITKIPKDYRYTPPPTPTTVIPPAFPVKTSAPVVIACPDQVRMKVGTEIYPLTRKNARFGVGTITCEYTYLESIQTVRPAPCPQQLPTVTVFGPDAGNTTSTQEGCIMGAAFCRGEANTYTGKLTIEKSGTCTYSSGLVNLAHSTQLNCLGNGQGSSAGYSADGKFLCW